MDNEDVEGDYLEEDMVTCCHRVTIFPAAIRNTAVTKPVVTTRFGLGSITWAKLFHYATVATIVAISWAVLYFILNDTMLPGNDGFGLYVLAIFSSWLGWCLSSIPYLQLPPVFGMLLAGLIVRNSGFYTIHEVLGVATTSKIRTFCLTFIMIRSGLQLSTTSLTKHTIFILILAIVPCTVEVLVLSICCRYVLSYHWDWSVMAGSAFLSSSSHSSSVRLFIYLLGSTRYVSQDDNQLHVAGDYHELRPSSGRTRLRREQGPRNDPLHRRIHRRCARHLAVYHLLLDRLRQRYDLPFHPFHPFHRLFFLCSCRSFQQLSYAPCRFRETLSSLVFHFSETSARNCNSNRVNDQRRIRISDERRSEWWYHVMSVCVRDTTLGIVTGILLGTWFVFVPHRSHVSTFVPSSIRSAFFYPSVPFRCTVIVRQIIQKYSNWFRMICLVLGSLMFTTFTAKLTISGGGYLATLVMSFVCMLGWRILTVSFDVSFHVRDAVGEPLKKKKKKEKKEKKEKKKKEKALLARYSRDWT